MRNLFLLLLLFQFSTAVSQILVDPVEGCAPLAGVQFDHSYSGATDILWIFGDGSSSNDGSAVHTYTNPGIYTVEFTAMVNGSAVSDSQIVTVHGNPTASFSNVPTACEGQSVVFTSTSTGTSGSVITGYDWAFGDGSVEQGSDSSPDHTYGSIGSYDVSLTVTDDNGCVGSTTVNSAIEVTEGPNIDITTDPSPASACNPPLVVTFNNNSTGNGLEWDWDLGNGQNSTNASPGSFTYADVGSYTVTAVATDASGCEIQTSIPVTVSSNSSEVLVVNAVNDTVCSEVIFDVIGSAGNIAINYGDGTQGGSLTHTYVSGGWQTATAIVTNGTCVTTSSVTFYVELPIPLFSLDPAIATCVNPMVAQTINNSFGVDAYQWIVNGDTIYEFEPLLTVPLNAPDTFDLIGYTEVEVILNVTSEHGCTASTSEIVTINLPTALHYPDSVEGCLPLALTFTDYSVSEEDIISWTWDFGDGTVITQNSGEPIGHVYETAGEYWTTLIIENEAGCIDTSFAHHILVGEPFELIIDASPPVGCPGVVSVINGTIEPAYVVDSLDVWIWNGDQIQIDDPSDFGTFLIDEPGLQQVDWILGFNGCYDIGSFDYPVKGGQCNPGNGSFTCTCDDPYLLEFTLDTMDVVSWDIDFGDGTVITNSTDLDVSHLYEEAGIYEVVITAQTNDPEFPEVTVSFLWAVYAIEADITADTLICVGVPWEFTASGSEFSGASCNFTYQWDFGDSTTYQHSDNNLMMHTYTETGIYTVKMWVTDANGCPDSTSIDVHVFGVDAEITSDVYIGCLPLDVEFLDVSIADTTLVAWEWDFGDGEGGITTQNTDHTYTFDTYTGAPYEVSLTSTDVLGCTDTDVYYIIPSVPEAQFNSSDDQVCTGEMVDYVPLVTLPGSTFDWVYDNGEIGSGSMGSTVYNEAGAYSASVTVTDSLGCTSTEVIDLPVEVQAMPEAGFSSSVDELENLCYPVTINFTDTSIADIFDSRDWDLGLGAPTIGDVTVGTIYNQPGAYDVSLIVETTFGCIDTTSRTFVVEGPVGGLVLDQNEICKGEDIIFSIADTADVAFWTFDFGDGTDTSDVDNVSHTYNFNPPGGQTLASVTFWSPDSTCAASFDEPVYILEVIADFTIAGLQFEADTAICYTGENLITDYSINATQWQWTVNGQTSNTETPPSISADPGDYDISLYIENVGLGCVDSTELALTIYPLPEAVASGGLACQGDPVQLLASGGEHYYWSNGATLNTDSVPDPIATPPVTTLYTVTVVDGNLCENTATALATILEEPEEFDYNETIIIGESIEDMDQSVGSFSIYQWSPPDGLSCTDCPDPDMMPLEDIIYTLTITDSMGCFEVQRLFDIKVLPLSTVDVPDVFTPNGDNVNELIFVDGHGIRELLEFTIYNRWGEVVFQTNDIEKGWDGKYKGEPQGTDTYAYTVTIIPWIDGGKPVERKGFFTLMR